MTIIENEADALVKPDALAVTVKSYVWIAAVRLTVPEITPVVSFKVSPLGRVPVVTS